jgi:quercetin dioxygenase-like cupin family protein
MTDKITLDNATKMPAGFEAYKMYSSENLDIVHLHLKAGEKIPVHSNPVDVIFCIIEGSAQLEVNGSLENLDKFDVIPVKAGIDRGMSNISKRDLRLLVIKKMAP